MAEKRYRIKHTFWLDVTKTEEYQLAEAIEDLKTKRSFTRTIRDGIRLITDLRAGNTDVLFELFPWVKERLTPHQTPLDLALLIEQFQKTMATREIAAAPGTFPVLATPLEKPKVSLNEAEAIKRTTQNTLAAIAEF
jgi:hypothetical protein